MIEKKIVEALDPVFDALVAIEKKIEAITLTPGPQGEPGKDGIDGKDIDPFAVAEILKKDDAFLSIVKGEKGDPGDQGVPGERGIDGTHGRDADPVAVAKALAENASFIGLVDKSVWEPGIYREGKFVSHYTGRTYQALTDTTDEPGDSAAWKRIGLDGFRDTGGFIADRKYEAGDFYHKDGATFLFDGANHRLFQAKPLTPGEYEKGLKQLRSTQAQTTKALLDRVERLEALIENYLQTAEGV